MKFIRTVCTLAFSLASTEAFATGAQRSFGGLATRSPIFSKTLPTSRTSVIRMMSTTESPIDFAKSEIANNKVVVFSKSRCPFCMATKQLFNDMDIDYTLHELDQMPDGYEVQQALAELTGQRTVPNVFINGQHVGGNDDTQAAASSGELQEMLG